MNKVAILFSFFFLLSFKAAKAQIDKQIAQIFLDDANVSTGQVGICIYEPATNKYWYQYNDTKYFIPASNTKLFTLYAGMKYLGDSILAAYYRVIDLPQKKLEIIGNGDPTFLHPAYRNQPLYDFLKKNSEKEIRLGELNPTINMEKTLTPFGKGWCWDDYNSSDMVERNFFPIYGNSVKFNLVNNNVSVSPDYFSKYTTRLQQPLTTFKVDRMRESNNFYVGRDSVNKRMVEIPIKFSSDNPNYSLEDSLLADTLKQKVELVSIMARSIKWMHKIYSQPTDSLLRPMIHRSNNFFAEQTLLMVSNELLGFMNDEKIIDTLLKTDLKDIPQKPKWVDGSGLSRYNLFTPQDFVYILNKMKNEFGFSRLKNIFPTGGEGTLLNYYGKDAGSFYAKTGTLSNNCALSGYLITNRGKLLIFSILNNNYITPATPIRKATERFLEKIMEKY